jgi:hypothetical protein
MGYEYDPFTGEQYYIPDDYTPDPYAESQQAPPANFAGQLGQLGGSVAGKYLGEKAIGGLGQALGIGGESASTLASYGGFLGPEAALAPEAASLASYGNFAGPAASTPMGGLASIGGYLGPAATLALAGYGISKMLRGKRASKDVEPGRLRDLAKRGIIDPSKIPQYQERLVDGEYAGKDLLGRAELYEMFGGDADSEKLAKFGDAAIGKNLFDQERGTLRSLASLANANASNLGRHNRDAVEAGTHPQYAAMRADAARKFGEMAKLADDAGLTFRDEYRDQFLGSTKMNPFLRKLGQTPEHDSDLLSAFNAGRGTSAPDPLVDALVGGGKPLMPDFEVRTADLRGPNNQIDPSKIPGIMSALQTGGSGRA